MVNISSQNNKINITVSSSGNTANANVTPDTAMYYSNKSKDWAISDRIVDNTDYSSKYYANESKKQADISTAKATEVVESGNTAVSNIESAKDNAIMDITNQENLSVDNVNTAGATQIANVNSAGITQINLAKEQVTLATNQANIATQQATIATNKTSEVVASGNEALANIDTAKNNAITSITNQETTSKNVLIDEGATQIGLIQNEGATQVANVQSTGFYMRDDKLYYINSQGEEEEFKSGGSGLEICDIGMALYIDETKGLRRYLNGQIVDINTNTQAFLDKLVKIKVLTPSLFCTEEEWQAIKTASKLGQCGKFVFNYTGAIITSVRIPAVVNINGLADMANAGLIKDEILPNIKADINITKAGEGIVSKGGAFKNSYATSMTYATHTGNTVDADLHIDFDASLSSSTYKDNAPVQQEAIQYPYFIQIATGVETEANIKDTLELNNPYSLFDSKYSDHELNNLSWLKSEGQWNSKAVYADAYDKLLKVYNGTETVEGLSVKLSTETYTDYDFVLNTTDETFRLPLKTKLASGKAVVGNGMTLGLTNGTQLGGLQEENDNTIRVRTNAYGKPIGTSWQEGNMYDRTLGVTTDPTKSGIETSDSGLYLYYYVGETVQNANLIDAGRIGEQLADKIGRTDCKAYITETYVNGTSGYRLYSDKWCEQWGTITATSSSSGGYDYTVTLLKPYKDASYQAYATPIPETMGQDAVGVLSTGRKTTQVTFGSRSGYTNGILWKTEGYIV